MRRRNFLAGAVAVAVTRVNAGAAPHIGRPEIEELHDAARRVRAIDMRLGGDVELDDAVMLARDAERLLDHAAIANDLRCKMLIAVGWLSTNVGFACHDAGRERDASALWRVAMDCGAATDNMSLVARALGCRARQAVWLGHPADAVASLERAINGDGGQLTATEKAMLWSLMARAQARGNDPGATLEAVRWSDQLFAAGDRDNLSERPWAAHYDLAHHYGDTAWALGVLARSGQRTAKVAAGRQQAAVHNHGDGALRSRTLSALSIATLDLDVGDAARGASEGRHALDLAEGMHSARVRSQVVALHNAAERLAVRGHVDSADLRDRAHDLIAAQ